MKLVSEIAKDSLPPKSEGKIVHKIAVLGGWKSLENPTMSTELCCTICGKTEHYTPIMYPPNHEKVWICANGLCESNMSVYQQTKGITPTPSGRAILWPKFCEINGIGNKQSDVKFESINQSQAKIDYMTKWIKSPADIIFMQGTTGTGKTYCSLAMCEYFTRKNMSCIFTTQKQMFNSWMETFKSDRVTGYINKIENVELLVVDDFGTGEISPAFMSFFMDLINTRMQWKNRGTVITTNLENDKFSEYCGEALADRITTGQNFKFEGESRRKNKTL